MSCIWAYLSKLSEFTEWWKFLGQWNVYGAAKVYHSSAWSVQQCPYMHCVQSRGDRPAATKPLKRHRRVQRGILPFWIEVFEMGWCVCLHCVCHLGCWCICQTDEESVDAWNWAEGVDEMTILKSFKTNKRGTEKNLLKNKSKEYGYSIWKINVLVLCTNDKHWKQERQERSTNSVSDTKEPWGAY